MSMRGLPLFPCRQDFNIWTHVKSNVWKAAFLSFITLSISIFTIDYFHFWKCFRKGLSLAAHWNLISR